MPRERRRREAPNGNSPSWDDGYEYIAPESNTSSEGWSAPFRSPPQPSDTPRASRYGPDGLPKPPLAEPRGSYMPAQPQSSGTATDSYNRARRSRHGRNSSPPAGSARNLTPTRHHEERPAKNRDAMDPEGSTNERTEHGSRSRPNKFESTKSSRRRTFSPSPSPPPRQRTYSPSPSRRRGVRTRSPGRDRSRDRRPPASYRPPSPSLSAGYGTSRRPSNYRSKTTSVREPKVDHVHGRDRRRDKDNRRSTGPPHSSTEGATKGRPVPGTAGAGGARPPMQRSKTTSTKDKGLSPRWQKAAIAALQAGSIAAMNARSQPGAWKGEKGARVATAALGAAAMDVLNMGGGSKGSALKEARGSDERRR